MKHLLRLLCLLIVSATSLTTAAEPNSPNVLFMTSDDLNTAARMTPWLQKSDWFWRKAPLFFSVGRAPERRA